MRQRIQSGVGGTLRFVPPESVLLGVATAATITIKRSSGIDLPTPVVNAAAAAPAPVAALDAPAVAGDRKLSFPVPLTVVPGTKYLLTSVDGESIIVEAVGVDASGVHKLLYLVDPLPRDFASGDALSGVEITYALSAAQCPDPFASSSLYSTAEEAIAQSWLYRAAWRYTIGGTSYDADQIYEVRRRLLKPTLDESDVTSLLPSPISELEPGSGVQAVRRAADTAWGDILDDLAQAGFNPDQVMDAERLRAAHISRSLYRLGIRWGPAWKEWTKEQQKAYADDLQEALQAGDWYDLRSDLVQATDEVLFPSISLVR